jgi:hypothetical protein
MAAGSIFGIFLVACVISIFEIRLIRKKGGKLEVTVFIVLLSAACGLFIAQKLHVPIPNPLVGIEALFKWAGH